MSLTTSTAEIYFSHESEQVSRVFVPFLDNEMFKLHSKISFGTRLGIKIPILKNITLNPGVGLDLVINDKKREFYKKP